MLDLRLRPAKDKILSGPARAIGTVLSPNQLTVVGLLITLAAAGAAASGAIAISLTLWLVGRIIDGLDGAVARAQGGGSDFGGYADQLADTVGYTAVPLGIAIGVDNQATWIGAAMLLGSFYINTVSWLYLSALFEKRGLGAADNQELTSVTMPTALVEGAETIVFFSLFLLLPQYANLLFFGMAGAVLFTVGQRIVLARPALRSEPTNGLESAAK